MKTLLILFIVSFSSIQCHCQNISTIAGNSIGFPFNGDNIPATNANISQPMSVLIDNNGELIFSDGQSRIRKINHADIITTIAGTDSVKYGGDGGPASAATMRVPADVAIDKLGNIYINEFASYRIRKINAGGIISTFAGIGVAGSSGDGGQATAAALSSAMAGLATDTLGNVHFGDGDNYKIRKVDAAGTITTIAGTGIAGFSGDGGQATAAKIGYAQALCFNSLGELIFSDNGNNRVRKISTAGIITTIAGTGTVGTSGEGGQATAAQLSGVTGITTDTAGNIYLADNPVGRVRKINAAGIITSIAGDGTATGFAGDGGPATAAKMMHLGGISSNKNGSELFICDFENYRIRKVKYTTGIDQLNGQETGRLIVSPNPSITGGFTVRMAAAVTGSVNVTVTNMLGAVVKEIKADTNTDIPVMLAAPAGIYLVSASTGGVVWSERLVIGK
ncbi:MAG: T9SS type A sorting domain-containing protein [Taibaiella sp.]|nr:T9SS type A sorting domain-containing protein [Taibaiella sp.]